MTLPGPHLIVNYTSADVPPNLMNSFKPMPIYQLPEGLTRDEQMQHSQLYVEATHQLTHMVTAFACNRLVFPPTDANLKYPSGIVANLLYLFQHQFVPGLVLVDYGDNDGGPPRRPVMNLSVDNLTSMATAWVTWHYGGPKPPWVHEDFGTDTI